MPCGPQLVFTVPTMASGVTLSSSIFLGNKSYPLVGLIIPTMPSGTDIRVRGAETESGVYRQIYAVPSRDNAASVLPWNVPSGITNCVVPMQMHMPYMKVELTTAVVDNPLSFKFVCND